MTTIEKIKDLKNRINTIKESLNIDNLENELKETQIRYEDPAVWEDSSRMRDIQIKIGELQHRISLYSDANSVYNELNYAYEFYLSCIEENETSYIDTAANDVDSLYSQCICTIEAAELEIMLGDESDELDCVLRINAGAGGTEAQDFAQMLGRMYVKYCTSHGYSARVVGEVRIDNIGYKSLTLEINGKRAFGFLKAENGVHRLVRVSPFNAQGKRMTSFASVYVSPLIDDNIIIELDESRLSFDYFRSSGAGGQNVNKVESGVRARYKYKDEDTGEEEEILVENTETRDQPVNKDNALRILKGILYQKALDKKRAKEREIEKNKKKIEWGSQIRSYVLDDCRVKDHRTGYEVRNPNAVLDGELDGFIKSYLLQENGKI